MVEISYKQPIELIDSDFFGHCSLQLLQMYHNKTKQMSSLRKSYEIFWLLQKQIKKLYDSARNHIRYLQNTWELKSLYSLIWEFFSILREQTQEHGYDHTDFGECC